MPTPGLSVYAFAIRLRMRQLGRILDEVGFIRIIVLLFIISPYAWTVFKSVWDGLPLGWIVPALFLTLLHSRRKDGAIFRTAGYSPFPIFGIEYLAASSPVIFSFLIHQNWVWAAIAIVFPFLLTLLPSGISKKLRSGRKRWSPFAAHQFEWVSGFRKQGALLLLFFFAGSGLSFLVWAAPLAAVFISGIVSSFYYECEPTQILQASPLPAGKFLRTKLLGAIRNTFFLIALPLTLYAVFNPELWVLSVAIALVALLMPATSVIFKYAFFEPGASRPRNGLFIGLGVFALFFPFFLPPIIALWIRFWKQAKSRISPYLYAES